MRRWVGDAVLEVNPASAFYAASVGVMFLLFSTAAAGGALLDEAENGTLDRVLSSQVGMGTLLAGKLEDPLLALWPQLAFLLGTAAIFFALARRLARRWEIA